MSTQNALRSGLDPESQFVLGESREEFAQLQTEWYLHHAPANPEERLQVDTIIRSEWFLRRYFRIEAQLWEYHSMKAERGTGVELGEAFSRASIIFMRFQRRITLAERSAKEAKAELERLKALRQPQQTTTETQQLGSFLTTPITPRPTGTSPDSETGAPRAVPSNVGQALCLENSQCGAGFVGPVGNRRTDCQIGPGEPRSPAER